MSFQQHGNGVDGKPDRIVSAIDLEVVSGRHEMLEFRAQVRRPRQQLDRLEACPLESSRKGVAGFADLAPGVPHVDEYLVDRLRGEVEIVLGLPLWSLIRAIVLVSL